MKILYAILLSAIIMTSCEQDPQKKAAEKEEHYSEVAQAEAAQAQSELESSRENANSAVIHATQAEMNKALKEVPLPDVEGNRAEQLYKQIANDGIEYVNSNDWSQAKKYGDRFNKHLKELTKLEEKGTISKDDALKIRTYINNLAKAISIEVTVVEIEPVEAE